jgi:hypothetical protein
MYYKFDPKEIHPVAIVVKRFSVADAMHQSGKELRVAACLPA